MLPKLWFGLSASCQDVKAATHKRAGTAQGLASSPSPTWAHLPRASICKNQSWGKGEVCSDNPNTQKVLCCRELVNFFTNNGKKNSFSQLRWAAGLAAPHPMCFDCDVKLSG